MEKKEGVIRVQKCLDTETVVKKVHKCGHGAIVILGTRRRVGQGLVERHRPTSGGWPLAPWR